MYSSTRTIVDKNSGELAFKIRDFDDLSSFDHVQRKNYYSLIFINEGFAKLKVDFSEYILQGKTMVCLSPYQPHMLTTSECCSGTMLNFHPDFFCTYRHQNDIETEGVLFHNFHSPPYFSVTEEELFLTLLNQMVKEIDRQVIAQHEVLVAFLKVFLIESVRQKKKFDTGIMPEETLSQSCVAKDLIRAVENNFRKIHAPQDYADILFLTPKTLARISKKYLNKTLSDLIVDRILVEAKRELYLTSKSVKEISALLGYQDEFYFSRLFKKKVGVSPDLYRKTVGFAKLDVA